MDSVVRLNALSEVIKKYEGIMTNKRGLFTVRQCVFIRKFWKVTVLLAGISLVVIIKLSRKQMSVKDFNVQNGNDPCNLRHLFDPPYLNSIHHLSGNESIMSRRRGRYTRAKEKMPPSKTQQLSRKLRSSKKIYCGKKKIFKGNKQRPIAKKFKKIKRDEKTEIKTEIKEEWIESDDVQVPVNEEALSLVVQSVHPEENIRNGEVETEKSKICKDTNAEIVSEGANEIDMSKSDIEEETIIELDDTSETMEIVLPDDEQNDELSDLDSSGNDAGMANLPLEKDDKDENTSSPSQNICSVCSAVTDSSASLTLHMKQHSLTNNQTHQCLICQKSLSSASSLDRHMLVHSGERPFKCKICDMSFTTNGNMHRHMRTHGDFDTSDLSLSLDLRKKDAQMTHEDSESDSRSSEEKLHCPVCGKTFLCNYGLQTHMETHPNDPIMCQNCNVLSKNYVAHVEHKCNTENSDIPACGFHELAFMDFTSNKFSLVSKSYCEQNIKRPSSAFHSFECSECKKAFPCSRALKLHQQVHENRIGTFCPSCHCDFPAAPFLQVHQLKHRAAEHCLHEYHRNGTQLAEKQLPHAGKEDFLALLNLQTKQSQMSVLRSISSNNVKEEDFENLDYFVHGKILKKQSKDDYDGNNNSTNSSTHNNNNNHINNNNNNNNDFADIQSIISLTSKAPIIPVAQSSPIAVRPASPYLATQQPKSPQIAESASASPETPSKEELISSHENQDVPDAESLDTTGIYSCKICTQQFKNIGTLKRHCKLHIQRGSNYSCHLCSYVSVDKSTLIRHLRTHNGERPFQCVICKYAFTTKANCERHVRKRHKKFGKAEIRNAMQYNPNMALRGSETTSSDIGNTETVCKYCGVDFKFNRVLRHHLRSLHNSCNRKPFSCKICKFGFSTKNNCIRHVLKQHPNLKDKLRSVVIPNSMKVQIQNSNENIMSTDVSNASTSENSVIDQSQPLDLHCNNVEKPLNLQTEKSSREFANEAVIAAEGLVSLSEALPLQEEPLDLAAHPIDLTCKPLAAVTKKVNPKPSSIYSLSPNANKHVTTVDLTTSVDLTSSIDLTTSSVDLTVRKSPVAVPEKTLQVEQSSHIQIERLQSNNNNAKSLEKVNQNEISFTSPGQKLRSFTCIYCKAGFTLKSNMERHIKRKHPEFARPTRSRNYIPSIVSPNLQKQNPTTLSDKTRDALRHVLSNKVQQVPVYKAFNSDTFPKIGSTFKIVTTTNSFLAQPNNSNLNSAINVSLDLSGKARNVTIVDINPAHVKLPETNEENGSDLASVSSVICTANSPQFKQYLEKPAELEKMDIGPKEPKKSNEEVSNIKKNEMPAVSCPFCERKFPWTSSLRRHILTHTGQKPFKCPKCSLWFTTKSNCERHLIRKHGHKGDLITRTVPDRPYKCNHCLTSTFSTQGNLRKHFYLKHWTKSYLGMNNKPVPSESIPVSPTEKKMDVSISSVTSKEHSYSQIERKHPYACHFCDSSFENKSSLSTHMFKHKNIVYMCYLCKKTFPSHEICLSHFKTSHSLVYLQIVQNENICLNSSGNFNKDLPEVSVPDNDSYPVACMVCFQKMSSVESLQQHFKKHLIKDKNSSDKDVSLNKNSMQSPSKREANNLELSDPVALANSKKLKATKSKVKNSLLYLFTPNSSCTPSIKSIKTVNSKVDSTSQDDDSDLIQNLLGIHDSKMIDEMLVSADSAARLLGVEEV